MKKEKILSVSAIQKGTVIDHIFKGQALKIMKILRLYANENQVTIGINLPGKRALKDLIKIKNVFLTESQASQIAIFSPDATVNVIENYEVAKKFRPQMPKTIANVLTCPNLQCITNFEKIPTFFLIDKNKNPIALRCKYCEKFFSKDQLDEGFFS